MILKSLIVEQYRGFASRTSIEFHPRFTLIVGENGAGKTSVLWALRVLLSHILPRLVKKSGKILPFQPEDIAGGWPYLRAEVAVNLDPEDMTATCVAQKNAAEFVPSTDKDGRPREHAVDTPDQYEVSVRAAASPQKQAGDSAPLVVYYSAHRSLALDRGASRARAAGGQFSRKLLQNIHRVAARKLEQLNAATVLDTLRVPPGDRLEALTHDRQGQHRIRVNDQWRVCFVWRDGHAYDVEIVDYH